MTHQALDSAFWLLGGILACSAIALASLFIWYWTLEYALRIFKLKTMILQAYLDRLQAKRGRVITLKGERAPHRT